MLTECQALLIACFTNINLQNPYNSVSQKRVRHRKVKCFPKVAQLETEAVLPYYLIKDKEKRLLGDGKGKKEKGYR